MTRKMWFILVMVAGVAGAGSTTPNEGSEAFAIYILEEGALNGYRWDETPDTGWIVLPREPWLDLDDIASYDFSTHCIYLEGTTSSRYFPETGTHFAVVADGELCYVGSFYHISSSCMGRDPRIATPIWRGERLTPLFDPEDVIRMGESYPIGTRAGTTAKDVRDDERVRAVLDRADKLRAGLRVTLDDVTVVDRADTTTVRYTFTVENLDADALYVLDPERIGTELFHYYTNGVVLWNPSERTGSFWSSLKKTPQQPAPGTQWNHDWFTRLGSRESMTRTVILRGYPRLPAAKYTCYLIYPGAHVAKEARRLPDGRIWFGHVRSSELTVTLAE
ncbi:MAG: hypothetical protein KAY24_02270 [Candidatus Eisenbacteria sp.]|nr:hypothetical protein [Candidatus Eisenbacteria bacterium]